jgi:hypothetical protein
LPVAADSLVAWYPFREGTGEDVTAGDSRFGDTTDYSGVVNGATYESNGGVTDIQTGANSGAFEFDGTDDVMEIGNIDVSGDITICCHVNNTNLSGFSLTFRTLVAQGAFSTSDFAFYYDTEGNGADTSDDSLVISESGNSVAARTNNTPLDKFLHFVVKVNGSDVTFFQDGEKLSQILADGTVNVTNTGQTARIGYDGFGDRFLQGFIDGVRIYNTALSDSQINQIYQNTKP